MNQMILCLTDSNFEDYVLNPSNIKNNELFLIDFWAEWCNPCKQMSVLIEEIANEFDTKLKISKLNIEDNPIVTKKYNIRSIPTLLLIRRGIVLSTLVGMVSKQKLREFIGMYL